MNIPFSPPKIDDEIISEVTDALKSGWITTGPKTKLFEKKIAEYCGVNNVSCKFLDIWCRVIIILVWG